jgi:hypothetical protein
MKAQIQAKGIDLQRDGGARIGAPGECTPSLRHERASAVVYNAHRSEIVRPRTGFVT